MTVTIPLHNKRPKTAPPSLLLLRPLVSLLLLPLLLLFLPHPPPPQKYLSRKAQITLYASHPATNLTTAERLALLQHYAPLVRVHNRDRWRPADPKMCYDGGTLIQFPDQCIEGEVREDWICKGGMKRPPTRRWHQERHVGPHGTENDSTTLPLTSLVNSPPTTQPSGAPSHSLNTPSQSSPREATGPKVERRVRRKRSLDPLSTSEDDTEILILDMADDEEMWDLGWQGDDDVLVVSEPMMRGSNVADDGSIENAAVVGQVVQEGKGNRTYLQVFASRCLEKRSWRFGASAI